MNRRNFLNAGIGLSLLSLIPRRLIADNISYNPLPETVKPLRLKQGDKVGLVAPAWLITEKELQASVERVKQLGLEPVYPDNILDKHGYFSGTDKQRADRFNDMVKNPDIKGIIFTNGGYGCARILDFIDYDLLKKNPKVIIGFSDSTALLNAVHQKTGVVTFHGPVAQTIHREYNKMQFRNIVMNPSAKYLIESSGSDLAKSAQDKVLERYTITSGRVQGELVGGNLTLICSLMGTPYQIDMKGKIVMIEEIDEEPYRIDRMLTQLIASGELAKASGIAFGVCRKCDKSDKTVAPNSFTLRQVIEDRIKPLDIPSVYGLSFGHNQCNFTFPIGLKAQLDTDKMTVELMERAVL